MLVTLICEKKMYSIHLPEKITGKYWITDEELPIKNQKILGIEADEEGGRWFIRNEKKHVIIPKDDKNSGDVLYLEEGKLYGLKIGQRVLETAFLLIEPFSLDRSSFTTYRLPRNIVLNVGRAEDNAIVINNPYVSSHHAQLRVNDNEIIIRDNEKTNGIYVNGKRVNNSKNLMPGDMVYIMGVKFILGDGFVAINNPENSVFIQHPELNVIEYKENVDDETIDIPEVDYYYRSPRFNRQFDPLELKVDMPSTPTADDDTPLIASIFPALLMGVASFSSGLIATINAVNNGGKIITSLPTMFMSVSMLIGMVVFPFIMKSRDKKKRKEKEKARREKYSTYINNLRHEINAAQRQQEEILRENNPNIVDLVSSDAFWQNQLWGKSFKHDDFLFIRFGLGNAPMKAKISFPEERFSIDDDIMRKELFAFKDEERLLKKVPIGVDLTKSRVLGIVGDSRQQCEVINNMFMQIYSLHSYDEVKTVILCEEKNLDKYSYTKWAPHSWDNEGKFRYFATNDDDARELSSHMNSIIKGRKEDKNNKLPHYIIVSFSTYLSNKCSFVSDILQDEQLAGFTVITVYPNINNLPKECCAMIELSDNMGLLYDEKASYVGKIGFVQDVVDVNLAEDIVRRVGDYRLDLQQGKYNLPDMLTFLDMFGVGKIEHLNVEKRWQENNPVMTLKTPVGVDTNGETFYLDLHEKFHGPHGLVAGMTGSGKSEFIITYILSMAVNYNPDEVAFVLIDYKGGGLAGAFDNEKYKLPHLAGTITNLDVSEITRSILSIKSELMRRQATFNEARKIANEGTMDIYKYQKMYRDGIVKEPMPHLFIISDEFAELKSQQPEFMEQLISTARIGRSLGVHLILATQKPSGVVNDQIWANSKFKVCLKVQDKADSMEMLKRPEAAEIAETGRFYLQVGYNEMFELGQSAWCGAPYLDSEHLNNTVDNNIEVLNNLGNIVDRIKPQNKETNASFGKQIVRIMEYLDSIATEENIVERQLWLPQIPANIVIEDIIHKYSKSGEQNNGLKAIIGEVDNPYKQQQSLLELDFGVDGNTIVYGAAGSGKEMFIRTVVYTLCRNYSAKEVNIYVLDFGSEMLRVFEQAPHVGGVVLDGENERLSSLFDILTKEIKRRKKILSDFGGEFDKYNQTVEEKLPYIVLFINNYSHFVENYESYDDVILSITRECSKYGIYVIITALTANSIRFRITQNFKKVFVLQMNDKNDYLSILGNTGGVFPAHNAGRGIYKTDETYMFQIASLTKNEDESSEYIRNFCNSLSEMEEIGKASPIPVVPKTLSHADYVKGKVDFTNVPIGMNRDTYQVIYKDLVQNNILCVLSREKQQALKTALGIVESLSKIPDSEICVISPNADAKIYVAFECEYVNDMFEDKINKLFEIALKRNNEIKKGIYKGDLKPIVVLVNELGTLKAKLSEDAYESLNVMMDKVESFCNMFFIVSDSVANSGFYSNEAWMLGRTAGSGLWVGNGINDQVRFNIRRKTKALLGEQDDNSGFVVENGAVIKVKYIWPDLANKEMEYE